MVGIRKVPRDIEVRNARGLGALRATGAAHEEIGRGDGLKSGPVHVCDRGDRLNGGRNGEVAAGFERRRMRFATTDHHANVHPVPKYM